MNENRRSRAGSSIALLLGALVCVLEPTWVIAGPRVDVVVAGNAPELEQFAGWELEAQFKRLFDADVKIGAAIPDKPTNLILIGNPDTNPAIKQLVKDWPKLSDQGHLVRSIKYQDQNALVVGGGSPVATLWAVYELGHRFGIRSVLFGDMYPASPPELKLDAVDILLEPALRVRAWRLIDNSFVGTESWGLPEHEQFIRQLAKLKFNRIVLEVHPWQPFVDFESGGIKKRTGELLRGHRFPVAGDTAGRAAFKGAKYFENPEFAGKHTYAERVTAGTRYISGLINAAHRVGMNAAVAFAPFEVPIEFAKVMGNTDIPLGTLSLSILQDINSKSNGERASKLEIAQMASYLKAYPNADFFYLKVPGDQIPLALFNKSATEKDHVPKHETTDSRTLATYVCVKNELILEEPDLRNSVLEFVGLSARQVAEKRDFLNHRPNKIPSGTLSLMLAGDSDGFLPQMSFSSLKIVIDELRTIKSDGFVTRSGTIGDSDFSVNFLSRSGFAPDITPKQALDDLVTPTLGVGTLDRTLKAFDLIEQATTLMDQNDNGFARPAADMVMKHYAASEPVPEWWGKVKGHYLAAMDEMYRVNTRAREGNRGFSLYLARRLEFGAEYFNCIEAVRKAGIAKAKGDKETQIAELEKAVESLDAALNAMAAVARSNSDRGVIAVLNEWGYRPLKKELEAQ